MTQQLKKARKPLLRSVNIAGQEFLQSRDQGVLPIFTWEVRRRVRKKKAVNIVVCGEAGEGKSYTGIDVCRNLDKNFGKVNSKYAKLDPEFALPQVVFNYRGYLQILLKLGMGHPILFDEPSYAMGKREWYKQINLALVKTVESARFMVKPLVIPIINTSLLDKTIRSYLIQYMVVMHDRGRGVVYRIKASQFQDKIYKRFICKIRYGLMQNDLCRKDSCLGCRDLKGCQLIRARYEKKKASIQLERYHQDYEDASAVEGSRLTLEQLIELVLPLTDRFYEDGRINVTKMKMLLRTEHSIKIGKNKSYDLKALLHINHPDLFPENL